jgi:hypothetical protein
LFLKQTTKNEPEVHNTAKPSSRIITCHFRCFRTIIQKVGQPYDLERGF